jgi:hypothetical protein
MQLTTSLILQTHNWQVIVGSACYVAAPVSSLSQVYMMLLSTLLHESQSKQYATISADP